MNRNIAATLVTCSLLAACGGGGGGISGNQQPPAAMLTITAANALTVSSTAYDAALASTNLGDLFGETGLIADGSGQAAKLDGSLGTASKINGGTGAQVPLPETTEACNVSGFVTFTGDIADPFTPTLTSGDFFNLDFDVCIDNPGETTDGMLGFVVDSFSGDFLGGLYSLMMTLTLDNFQVMTAADTVTSNGAATVTLNTLDASALSASVSGSSLTVDSNSNAESLRNFASTQTVNLSVVPSPYTTTASGTLDTTQLAGSVRYSTPVTLAGFDDDYPGVGEFLVTGDNSSVRLVAESNVLVRVEIDLDNDGVVDQTINTSWAELAAQ